jgi:hypothetical protein
MKNFPFPGTILEMFFQTWKSSQVDLSEVIRWKLHLNDGIAKVGMRPQNVLQHTYSFSLFCGIACSMLAPYVYAASRVRLDLLLLERAFKWHDYGEGLKKRDVHGVLKKAQDDVDEYLAFREHIKMWPTVIREEYKRAFLLQFVLKGNALFPDEAKKIMREIEEIYHYEAFIFTALEKFEYIFYPIEVEEQHEYLLTWVLRGGLPKMRKYVWEIPGFREVIFTDLLEGQIVEYLKAHEDVPDEDKFLKKFR